MNFPFTVMGEQIRTSYDLEGTPEKGRIAGLWHKFFSAGGPQRFAHRKNDNVFAVYCDYESDHLGSYSLLVGCETDAGPDGLSRIVVPPAKYKIFECQGNVPQMVVETWLRVWKHFADSAPEKRAYTVDFERYDFSDPEHVKLEIYIAVA